MTIGLDRVQINAFPKFGGVLRKAASERRKKMAHGVSRGAASV
jgi:hypothetical protein